METTQFSETGNSSVFTGSEGMLVWAFFHCLLSVCRLAQMQMVSGSSNLVRI